MNLIKHTIKSKRNQNKAVKTIDTKKISVLLVEEIPSTPTMLKKGLIELTYHVTKHISFDDSIIEQIEFCNPDVLILSTKVLSEKTLKVLAEIDKISPLPIVIFSESEKLRGPMGVVQSTAIPMDDLIVFELLTVLS